VFAALIQSHDESTTVLKARNHKAGLPITEAARSDRLASPFPIVKVYKDSAILI
jgi:hypothetical protein